MYIRECTIDDAGKLAELNKQLIEDEHSSNPMSTDELQGRMTGFLSTEYSAYYFMEGEDIIGYALVRNNCYPTYLRQFFINRTFRGRHYGTKAFHLLLEHLGVTSIDIEVLTANKSGVLFWESCGFREISRYMRYGG